MACACKVNQEIDKIHKYYSNNGKNKPNSEKSLSINKKDAAITAFIYLLLLPLIPIMFLFVIFYAIFSRDGKISFKKFLGFIHNTRNGRKQQII